METQDISKDIERQTDAYVGELLVKFFNEEADDVSIDEEFLFTQARKRVTDAFSKVSAQQMVEIKKKVIRDMRYGKRIPDIKRWLKDTIGFNDYMARMVILSVKKILAEEYSQYKEDVAKSNVSTLLQIKDEAIDANDRRLALDAVRELNKMTGQYEENINLNTDSIEIKFE